VVSLRIARKLKTKKMVGLIITNRKMSFNW